MEQADALAADLKAAEGALTQAKKNADEGKRALAQERTTLGTELARLARERQDATAHVDKALLGKYEQILKQRRGIAVVRMNAELCTACHVRQRPHVVQQIRRNDSIVQCESCQRILYFETPRASDASEPGERSGTNGVPASEPVRGSGGTKSPG
jgi:predicted  nucleic acid-binding Zn-ribbon protein